MRTILKSGKSLTFELQNASKRFLASLDFFLRFDDVEYLVTFWTFW